MQIWIVESHTGEYADKTSSIVKVFSIESRAKNFVDNMNADLISNFKHTSNMCENKNKYFLEDETIHGRIDYTGMSYHYHGPYEVE